MPGVKFVDNDANFTFRNGAADHAAFQTDGLHLSESGVGRLLLNLSLPEQPPKQNKRQHQQQHRHVSNATNHDRLPNARVAPDGNWTVVKRRTRLSMGKCAKCGQTNHVTSTCRHPDKVLCRQCGERGHKEKHHCRDFEMGLNDLAMELSLNTQTENADSTRFYVPNPTMDKILNGICLP